MTENQPIALNKKKGRPRIHPDRRAYKAEMEKKRRAKIKAAKEVDMGGMK